MNLTLVRSGRVIRLAVGNALFIGGAAMIVAGSWLASEWWQLASCLIGGIVLFALAELIAPFRDRHARPGSPGRGVG